MSAQRPMYSPQPVLKAIISGYSAFLPLFHNAFSPTSNISFMSPQVPKSATTIDGAIPDDKRNPDISTPAQASTTLRPQFIDYSPGDGGERYPAIAVPSKAPRPLPKAPRPLPTTPSLHSLRDRDARSREDSRPSVSIAPATTVDHSIREARNEYYHGNPIKTEMPLHVASGHPPIDRGGGAVQSREPRHGGVDPNFPFPTEAPAATMEPCSVVCRDEDTGSKEVPSISLFQESSNFQISNTNINAIGGNATIIRFGDGQFTQIQRNLVRCTYTSRLKHNPILVDL
ncbi:hypothetical protein JOM56_007047 [Amanita muscaria]